MKDRKIDWNKDGQLWIGHIQTIGWIKTKAGRKMDSLIVVFFFIKYLKLFVPTYTIGSR